MKRLIVWLALCSGGCLDLTSALRREVHVADRDPNLPAYQRQEWDAHGAREAALAEAARTLGCPRESLTVERHDGTFVAEGCGGGVFVDVSYVDRLLSADDASVTRHRFFDVSRDGADRAVDEWAKQASLGDDDWRPYFSSFDAGGDASRIGAELRAIAERNRRGAIDLDCARARVSLAMVRHRSLTLRFAEGCGKRATYADEVLIGLVPINEPGKLAQF